MAWKNGVPCIRSSQVVLGHVGVAVEVDDADVAVDVGRQAADVGIADRVVAAEDDRENFALVDVGDRLVDLVEALLDVGRDDRDIADVDHVERFRADRRPSRSCSRCRAPRSGASPADRSGCPARKVVPVSSGTPTTATSCPPSSRISFSNGAPMKVPLRREP